MRGLDRRRVFEILEVGSNGDRTSLVCDLAIMALIVLNVASAIAESVPSWGSSYADLFAAFELFSVAVFSTEYVLRVATIVEGQDPRFHSPIAGRLRYMATPLAMTDLLAFLPFYLSAVIGIDLRMLRVLRLIRIFKLAHYFSALNILLDVIRIERHAFGAAYFVVVLGLLMAGSGVYLFEHEAQPEAFGSIPASLWWAVATLTTVGYGDVTPITLGGKMFGTFVMMLGVGVVAVPTGILATGFALELRKRREQYREELAAALEDGVIGSDERARLDELRESLSLSAETTADMEVSSLGLLEMAGRQLQACPHCGELLVDGAKDPLAEVEAETRVPAPASTTPGTRRPGER
ncbi:MAG: Ion transport protein [Deltaproteobacteria bacterium]|nr:Ion transport protein [Deltaproteobacteria bacterium]